MSEFDFIDLRPRVWEDAFPWLASKSSPGNGYLGSIRDTAIDDADAASRNRILDNLVSVAIDRLGRWPIGEILPGMPLDVPIDQLDLPVRAFNVLYHEQRLTTGDLVDLPLDELLTYRNAGIGTVTAILRQLADRSTSRPQTSLANDATTVAEPVPLKQWLGDLVSDIELLAEWNHTIGLIDRGLLSPLSSGAPTEVVAARDRVLALSAAEVLPSSAPDVADLLEQFILGMDERFRAIIARRLFAWKPVTLDELGQEFGVTRERVRQLESKARAKLEEWVAEGTPIGRVRALIRSEIRGVRPLAALLAEVPTLARLVESVDQPAWRVFDMLDDAYEIAGGWCAEPSFDAAERETAIFLDELADDFGVVRLADIDPVGSKESGARPWLTDWLIHLGYELRRDFVLLRTSSINDLAVALLAIEGGPLTIDELFGRVGRGSLANLRNQLNADPRFHKVDVVHWALASWGMNNYSNIRAEIGKLLEQAGGELPLASVVDSLVARFGVSAASVNVYAGSPPFEVRNGIARALSVEIRGGKNPAKVQGYYRRGDDWLYRTAVTHDHLRGSGWGASTAVATIVSMSPGEYAELPTRLGPQKFSWKNPQPAYGSIKRFLEADDLGIGDDIFLVFRGDGTFDVENLPGVPEKPLAQALRLVGADMSLEGAEAADALGSAIRYASGSDLVTIAAGYKARREQQICDLLLGADLE